MDRDAPMDLDRADFSLSPLGYNRWQVHEHIRRLTETIHTERRHNQDLQSQVAGLKLADSPQESRESTSAEVLAMAQRVADETRKAAEVSAAHIREEARQSVQAELTQARSELSQLKYDLDRLREEKAKLVEEYRSFLKGHLDALEDEGRAFSESGLAVVHHDG